MSNAPIQLDDPDLWRREAFIDGAWVTAQSGRRFAVDDPATERIVTEVADLGRNDVELAIDAAARAFPDWRATSAQDRAACLHRWADEIRRNRGDLARIVSLEVGRSMLEARN